MKNIKDVLKGTVFKFVGIVLILIGVIMIFTPGPGLLFMALGAASFIGDKEEVKKYINEAKEKIEKIRKR